MALTLLSNPGAIAFAKNPMIIKLRADDGVELFDALGVTSKLVYLNTGRFSNSDTLTIAYDEPDGTSETVVFTAESTYAADNEIPDDSFAGSDSEYWLALRNKVASHPRIAPFFAVDLISESGNKIRIRAKSTDDGWALTVTNDAGFTIEDVVAQTTTLPENYKVRMEVFIEETYRAGDFVRSAQLEGYPEAETGFIYFDISSVLAATCRATRQEPLTPIWGTSEPEIADNIRQYYFRYTEESGSPVITEEWVYSAVKSAMDGGVSQAVFAESDFIAGLNDEDSLLTWLPQNKHIALAQPEYIAWYNFNANSREVFIRVTWYDIDNNATTSQNVFDTDPITVRSKEVAIFPVGTEALGIDGLADMYKYTVQVVEDSGIPDVYNYHSQAWTYFIDLDYYESERYIQYINGFGVPETWRCTGQYGQRLKVDRNVASKVLAPGYSQYDSDTAQFARSFQKELVYRTGFLTPTEAQALQEMLISNDVYDVSATGYIPLRIVTDSFQVTETRQELHSYTFTALPRMDLINFSRIKESTMASDAWQQPDSESWFDTLTIPWTQP